jgi:cob(I)alamin adenosyltransferase
VRISKVTTKTGDQGQTSLADGQRVAKSSARIAAIGEVDELNSLLGVVATKQHSEKVTALIGILQHHLFVLGADLATPEAATVTWSVRRIAAAEVEEVESAIEELNADLPPLKEFILPGGSLAGALLHLARTVARRAERAMAAVAAAEPLNPLALVYLNRLSDLLFVLARQVNRDAGVPESPANFH